MAIRDDFAPGEVLAAADLNDTFASKANYPSGGTDGQALVKDGTDTAWATVDVGLVPSTPTSIANSGGSASLSGNTVTFSGVSSVSLNGCFTGDYDNYRVIAVIVSSATATRQIRMRVGGVDNSTASSYNIRGTSQTGATNRYASLNETFFDAGAMDTLRGTLVADIIGAAVNASTLLTYISYGQDAHIVASGRHDVATAYDGFSLIPSTGTITGNVSVFGYKK